MSENVMSTGYMVPLNRKITREEREEWQEVLWDEKSLVNFNYEGTMAYTDIRGDEYGIHFSMPNPEDYGPFDILEQFGLSIEKDKARPYFCLWYNGSDSYMDSMKLEDFLRINSIKGTIDNGK